MPVGPHMLLQPLWASCIERPCIRVLMTSVQFRANGTAVAATIAAPISFAGLAMALESSEPLVVVWQTFARADQYVEFLSFRAGWLKVGMHRG